VARNYTHANDKPTLVLGGTGKTGRRVVERLEARPPGEGRLAVGGASARDRHERRLERVRGLLQRSRDDG